MSSLLTTRGSRRVFPHFFASCFIFHAARSSGVSPIIPSSPSALRLTFCLIRSSSASAGEADAVLFAPAAVFLFHPLSHRRSPPSLPHGRNVSSLRFT